MFRKGMGLEKKKNMMEWFHSQAKQLLEGSTIIPTFTIFEFLARFTKIHTELQGKPCLEIGSGPYPLVAWFENPRNAVVDPLWNQFKEKSDSKLRHHSVPMEVFVGEEEFDFVIMNDVLNYVLEPKNVLYRAIIALNIGGTLLISNPIRETDSMILNKWADSKSIEKVLPPGVKVIRHNDSYEACFTWINLEVCKVCMI